jgi:hypothetical protein
MFTKERERTHEVVRTDGSIQPRFSPLPGVPKLDPEDQFFERPLTLIAVT